MASDVVVNFQVGGIARVQEAFRSIQQASARAERATVRSSQTTQRTREREYAQLAKTSAKWSRDAVKETERAERDKAKAVERSAKERVGIMLKADKMQVQAQKEAAREFSRIEEAKNRESARWVKKREKEEIESSRRTLRARESFARSIAGSAGRGLSAGARAATSATMSMAGTALSLGGGFSLADSMSQRMSLDRNAALLANSAYIPGVTARPDKKKITDRARAVQTESGIDAAELVEGTQNYVAKSSDFAGGMENMGFFAKLAKGSGTDFGKLTSAAGILRAQNANLGTDDMKQMLLDIVAQGKLGSVELPDLARVAGKVTKTSAMYGMNQTDAQRQLLGMSQIAMRTSGGPDEAATVVSNLGSDALKHQKKIGGITDAAGKLIAPGALTEKVFAQTGGNLGKIQDLGFGQRSMKWFEALAPIFDAKKEELSQSSPGMSAADRNKQAAQAVADEIKKATGASYTQQDANDDFANVISEPAEQVNMAFQQLRDQVGTQLLPEFVKLIPVLKNMTPIFVDLMKKGVPSFLHLIESASQFASAHKGIIDSIAEHPIGALIGFEMAKAIGGAGLGAVMEKALATKLGAAGGLTIGTAMMAVQLGMIAIDKMGEDEANKNRHQVETGLGGINTVNALRGGIRNGNLTPEQIEAAKRTQAELSGEVDSAKGALGKRAGGFFNTTFGGLAKVGDWISGGVDAVARQTAGTTPGAFKTNNAGDAAQAEHDAQRARYEAAASALEELTKVIKESEAALAAHAETTTSITKPNRDKSHVDRN